MKNLAKIRLMARLRRRLEASHLRDMLAVALVEQMLLAGTEYAPTTAEQGTARQKGETHVERLVRALRTAGKPMRAPELAVAAGISATGARYQLGRPHNAHLFTRCPTGNPSRPEWGLVEWVRQPAPPQPAEVPA